MKKVVWGRHKTQIWQTSRRQTDGNEIALQSKANYSRNVHGSGRPAGRVESGRVGENWPMDICGPATIR